MQSTECAARRQKQRPAAEITLQLAHENTSSNNKTERYCMQCRSAYCTIFLDRTGRAYFRNGSEPISAASFALPLHTWKKQMTRTTKTTVIAIAPTIGTMKVQTRTRDTIRSS